MLDELILSAVKSGIFALLFLFLLLYVLRDSDRRETKYQNIIDGLVKKLDIVENIDSNVTKIHDIVSKETVISDK